MFLGRLTSESGGADCDPQWGFTFGSIADLGGGEACEREVETPRGATLWSVVCTVRVDLEDRYFLFDGWWSLGVEDATVAGQDGTPFHPAVFIRGGEAAGECEYRGHVTRREYLR